MSLPSSLDSKFTQTFDGMRAARFVSASEAHNMESALRESGVSYKTKIVKHKRRGREFWVMLVEVQHA
jgi:hypothetical protein